MTHVTMTTNTAKLTLQLFPLSPTAIRNLRAPSEITYPTLIACSDRDKSTTHE